MKQMTGYSVKNVIMNLNNMKIQNLNEKELPDDYPVYGNYLYVCDGKVISCDLMEGTILDLKRFLRKYDKLEAKIITNCDIFGRQKLKK